MLIVNPDAQLASDALRALVETAQADGIAGSGRFCTTTLVRPASSIGDQPAAGTGLSPGPAVLVLTIRGAAQVSAAALRAGR